MKVMCWLRFANCVDRRGSYLGPFAIVSRLLFAVVGIPVDFQEGLEGAEWQDHTFTSSECATHTLFLFFFAWVVCAVSPLKYTPIELYTFMCTNAHIQCITKLL